MKLAISSPNGKFNSPFCDFFARCRYFIFVDTETRNWEAIPNMVATAHSDAGTQAVQFLANNGVEATISGRYGPTAFSALMEAGIQALVADGGTPAELLDKFLAGELEQVNSIKVRH